MKSCKISNQKQSIQAMIKLYCNKNHGTKKTLCPECTELLNYAIMRLDNCRYGEDKPNCEDCTTHCYKKDMKEKIIKVMRFSGPRIIFYNPKIAIKHLISKKFTSK